MPKQYYKKYKMITSQRFAINRSWPIFLSEEWERLISAIRNKNLYGNLEYTTPSKEQEKEKYLQILVYYDCRENTM